MNPMDLMQLSGRFSILGKQHPRVIAFFQENGHELKEGTILTLNVKTKEGKEMVTNMRLSPEDVETLKLIAKLIQ